ncbi:unnamed protein product [Psylliodes chrysocephalus]|uniref:Uncharacterized protein n=1 Tax=Psylliodes chrysocephalus TaxID=3402493 RepID=A0A9P0CRK9_9CUCU|nr:unnamed protein product [Psylliodes chrysocephala]
MFQLNLNGYDKYVFTLNLNLQGETNVYYGFVIPTIASMKIKLERLKTENFKYFPCALDEIIKSVSTRFQDYLSFSNKNAVLAAVSHPNFKLRWITVFKEKGDLEQQTEKLKRMLINTANDVTVDNNIPRIESESRSEHPGPKKTVLYKNRLDPQVIENIRAKVELELGISLTQVVQPDGRNRYPPQYAEPSAEDQEALDAISEALKWILH